MLKRKKHSTKTRNKEKSIENDILETEIKLKEHRDQEKNTMEKKVIDNMKENPKVLFDYIRRQKDRDTKLGRAVQERKRLRIWFKRNMQNADWAV